MRRAALLLMLSMLAPSIEAVVCVAKCVSAELQNAAAVAPVQSCHGQDSRNDPAAFINTAAGVCHAKADPKLATVTDRLVPKAMTPGARLFTALPRYNPQAVVLSSYSVSRTSTVVATTQLRI